ncbi:MAG: hypothetical protein WBA68_04245, partial [Alteraurantiacibacter sp.]
ATACAPAADEPTTPPDTAREVPPPPDAMAQSPTKEQQDAFLSAVYGTDPGEARRRQRNEALIAEFNRAAMQSRDTRVSAIWIRHEPTYAVVVNAKPPFDRAALAALAPEALRGDLEFVAVSRTRPEISRDEDRLIAAFRSFDFAWSGGYRVQEDRFLYTAGAPTAAERMRAAVPEDLLDVTDIAVEPQPVPL